MIQDYDDFDISNEMSELESFLKIGAGSSDGIMSGEGSVGVLANA